jgi:DNA polymerase-3 subunit beta
MQCSVSKEEILDQVVSAEKVTGKNTTLPVLSCLLLTVEGDVLSITATNLEVGVRYQVQVRDVSPGSAAVSGSVLAHVLSSLPSGTKLTLSTDEGHLSVTSGEGESRIALQDTDEYPALPTVTDGTTVTLPVAELRDGITSVVYCASTSTIKPELSSVFVYPHGATLITAATDSFRLAERTLPLKKQAESDPFLIPAKSTSDLLRVLEGDKGSVTLTVNEHQLSLERDGVYLTLRLVAGTFPDYTAIIPKKYEAEATLLVFDFERALRKASAFRDQFNQTTLTVSPADKQLTIHTQNDTVGETTDRIAAALTGEELTISFNHKYLQDALHSIATDSITLQFAGQAQAAVVRPVGDTSFLYLVMPMNR